MSIIDKGIENYIDVLLEFFEGSLGELQQHAYQSGYPVIAKDTARFLSTMICIKKPLNILEIGCCIGFSSILMSHFMPEGGHITTIERYDVMIDKAKANFKHFGLKDRITLIEGDARTVLPALDGTFDFVFLDAGKGQYLNFLPDIIRIMGKGGILIADDIFQKGYVAKEDKKDIPRRQRTTYGRMRDFLHVLTHTEGLESCIIPLDDGLIMTTKCIDKISI